jgi:hypothetical protein
MNPTHTTGTHTTGTGSPVTITEIADFLHHLRNLSRPPAPDGAHPDGAERAVFLARKTDLFARIAAQHPELIPAPESPTDGGPTDGGPTDGGPTDGAPTDGAPTDGGPA